MGFELDAIQRGFQPSDFKPMSSVGSGVNEIRVMGEDGIARCFYATKYGDRVLMIHVFEKKTQKTAQSDIELGRKRLAAYLKELKKLKITSPKVGCLTNSSAKKKLPTWSFALSS